MAALAPRMTSTTSILGLRLPRTPQFVCHSTPCSNRQRLRRVSASAVETSTAAPLSTYLRDVAAVSPPPALPLLLSALEAKGFLPEDPADRKGIVPLLIPVATDPHSGQRLAFLRWPTPPEGMELPVVSLEADGTVRLQAKSPLEWVNRALAEEEAAESGGAAVAAAVAEAEVELRRRGEEGPVEVYRPGTFTSSGIPRIDVFLLKKVGPFPDVMERLALGHLSRGDEVSALVTGEFYANPRHFPGFGRPFIFNAQLLSKVGRPSESRDAARIALRSPWWTLGVPYQEAADLAGFGNTLLEYAQERVSEEGRKADLQKGKSPAQVSLDQAAFLMDVTAAKGSWDDIRERLATLYEEGGLPEVAAFVTAAQP